MSKVSSKYPLEADVIQAREYAEWIQGFLETDKTSTFFLDNFDPCGA
jgi:hypothetical protein